MSTPEESPNRAYYRSRHGRWAGAFELRITDRAALSAEGLALSDRMNVWSLSLMQRVLGPCRIETSVDAASRISAGEVLHTTRLSKWGITLFRSTEIIALDDNGRDFTMRVAMGLWPRPSHVTRTDDSRGQVDATGTRASYDFPWLGTRMRQTGECEGESVTRLTQETPFSRGVVVLERRGRPGVTE